MRLRSSWKRVFALLAVFVVGLASLTGCQKEVKESQQVKEIVLVDDAGGKITLSKPAEKVVSLAPSNTEIVFAVGGGDKLVGVTTYCDYPEEAKQKEKIGDFANPNVEKIISLKPQVVLATGGVQKGVVDRLTKFKIKVFVVDPKNFEELFADIEKVGKIIGQETEAKRVVDDMKAKVEEVKNKIPKDVKPRVFFEIYSQPLMTAGKNTFIDDMLRIAGAENVGATAGEGYPQFSEEQLVKENPDVYLAVKGSMNEPEAIKKRAGYSALKAVKEGKVFVIDDNLVTRPGPRLVDGLREVAKALYPGVF